MDTAELKKLQEENRQLKETVRQLNQTLNRMLEQYIVKK